MVPFRILIIVCDRRIITAEIILTLPQLKCNCALGALYVAEYVNSRRNKIDQSSGND